MNSGSGTQGEEVRINKTADLDKHLVSYMRDADNGVFKIMVDGESQSNAYGIHYTGEMENSAEIILGALESTRSTSRNLRGVLVKSLSLLVIH